MYVRCISEHWLHSYDLFVLNNVHPEFDVWGLASPDEEDSTYCAPWYRRGHGGVAILWRKTLHNVQKLKQFSNHRCVGITLDNSILSSPYTYPPGQDAQTRLKRA